MRCTDAFRQQVSITNTINRSLMRKFGLTLTGIMAQFIPSAKTIMSPVTIFVISSISFFGCQQSAQKTDTITDSLPERMSANTMLTDTDNRDIILPDSTTVKNKIESIPEFFIREGTHNLSIQWISWEELGEAEVKYLGNNIYSILGEQRNEAAGDYLKLEGTLEPVSETELIFNGTVEHQISHLNQGRPCIKKGRQTFKSTKNRKYWRMQDMQNCEGGRVTDYIDIYF